MLRSRVLLLLRSSLKLLGLNSVHLGWLLLLLRVHALLLLLLLQHGVVLLLGRVLMLHHLASHTSGQSSHLRLQTGECAPVCALPVAMSTGAQ